MCVWTYWWRRWSRGRVCRWTTVQAAPWSTSSELRWSHGCPPTSRPAGSPSHLDQDRDSGQSATNRDFERTAGSSTCGSALRVCFLLETLTVIDSKAQFLYDGQVPANPVQTVHTQTCKGWWDGKHVKPEIYHLCYDEAVKPASGFYNREWKERKCVWVRKKRAVVLHVVDAHLDEAGHAAALPVTQTGQAAAKHLIWRRNKQQAHVTKWQPSKVCVW